MKYRSTRGDPTLLSFKEAVLSGLSPDGGLYIPTSIPQVSLSTLQSWSTLSFSDLAFNIYRPFISEEDICDIDLKDICNRSFSTFSDASVVPLKRLPRDNFWVLELFHGPTFAFKDVALQFLGNLFEYFLRDSTSSITVVGATSGDTGGAAIYGLKKKDKIDLFILHPHNRISQIQQAQMTSILDSNGSFDDCQDIVKTLFSDAKFKKKYRLAAINSINWARILAQTTYYFYSFFQLAKQTGQPAGVSSYLAKLKVKYSVPSGNFGDVLAGFYAKQMGLPVDGFIIATNDNDILDRFLKTGRYDKVQGADPVKQTLSPAMDILISSNFERLLWYLVQDEDKVSAVSSVAAGSAACTTINSFMQDLKGKGGFKVNAAQLKLARSMFESCRVNDQETTEVIARYYHTQYLSDSLDVADPYILDPHTAVGVLAAERLSFGYTICLATASPGKFPDAVLGAINSDPPALAFQRGFKPLGFSDIAPQALVDLEGLPQRMTIVKTEGKMENGIRGVRTVIEGTLNKPKL